MGMGWGGGRARNYNGLCKNMYTVFPSKRRIIGFSVQILDIQSLHFYSDVTTIYNIWNK